MSVWRERMRAHGGAPYVHLIVNEGREAGASLPHTHAQLYALPFVPAAIARERERFDGLLGPHARPQPARGPAPGGGAPRGTGRGDRLEAVVLPFAARRSISSSPRRPAVRFSDDGPVGAGALHEALGRLAGVLGALPPLNMGAHRPARRRPLLLAHRRDAAPGSARRAGARHRRYLNVLAPEDAARRLREASV